MMEFSENTNTSATIKIPSFLASQSVILQMSFDLIDFSALSTCKQLANTIARSMADQTQNIWDFMQAKTAKSQDIQIAKAN